MRRAARNRRRPPLADAGASSAPSGAAIPSITEHVATLGLDLQVVQRAPATRGFVPLPRRWVIERTLGWLMQHRRLVRDFETHPHRSAAMIHIAAIDLMTRRLSRENTPTWRDT